MAAQGRMLQFKYLFPWLYALWVDAGRIGLRLHWLFWKPIRVRIADIWTFSAVAGSCGVILAILLFVFRGEREVDAQQPLRFSSAPPEATPAADAFIPAALTGNQPGPTTPRSSIPVQPVTQTGTPRITIRSATNLESSLTRTLLPAGWDQRETMELVSLPDPHVEMRLFDPREPWRLASFIPMSDAAPFNSYIDRVGRLDAAEFGPSLVAPSEAIYAFDPVEASQQPMVHVTKHVPQQVRRGERLTYEIEIQNLTVAPLESVLVREKLSALDRVESVEPEAKVVGDHLWWDLSLAPRETRVLRVAILPSELGTVTAELDVTVVSRVGAVTRVSEPPIVEAPEPSIPDVETSVAQQPAPAVDPFPESQPLPPRSSIPSLPAHEPRPQLSLSFQADDRATVGREWTALFTVANTGDAPAFDVSVDIELPEHLRHRHGAVVRHIIDSLAPGESHTARLIVVAETAGRSQFAAHLSMAGELVEQEPIELRIAPRPPVAQASHETAVRRPEPRPCIPPTTLLQPGCAW